MAAVKIEKIDYKETFKSDFKKAPIEIQRAAKEATKLLLRNPQPQKLRLHSLNGCFDPRILKIDVLTNKSWQITFEMEGTTAILRRLGTHQKINRLS